MDEFAPACGTDDERRTRYLLLRFLDELADGELKAKFAGKAKALGYERSRPPAKMTGPSGEPLVPVGSPAPSQPPPPKHSCRCSCGSSPVSPRAYPPTGDHGFQDAVYRPKDPSGSPSAPPPPESPEDDFSYEVVIIDPNILESIAPLMKTFWEDDFAALPLSRFLAER